MAAGESCKTRETHAESDWFFVGERSVPLAAFKVAFLSSVSELNWTWSEPRKIVCQICVRVNRTCSQPVRAKLRITLSWDCALYKIQLTSFCSQTQPFCFQLTSSGFFANSIFPPLWWGIPDPNCNYHAARAFLARISNFLFGHLSQEINTPNLLTLSNFVST